MKKVKIKSYAKINLTLEIKGVEGGYHLLDSLVASVDLYDLIVAKRRKDDRVIVKMKGLGSEQIPAETNNAQRAAELFAATFRTTGAEITIYRNIPVGGGLGGSSADTVGVLNAMAKLYDIVDRDKLKELADRLGSDTGYMLTGGFARMTGRGEKVQPLDIDTTLHLLLLCPESFVSAKDCYAQYDVTPKTLEYRGEPTDDLIACLRQGKVNEGGMYLMNDLYRAACALNDDVSIAYKEAEDFSPLGVNMTGSGSCVFALFENKELCEWAKSRYRGSYRAIVAQTIVPKYE